MSGFSGATGGWVAREGRRTTDPAEAEGRLPVLETEGIRVGPSPLTDWPVVAGVDIATGGLSR